MKSLYEIDKARLEKKNQDEKLKFERRLEQLQEEMNGKVKEMQYLQSENIHLMQDRQRQNDQKQLSSLQTLENELKAKNLQLDSMEKLYKETKENLFSV